MKIAVNTIIILLYTTVTFVYYYSWFLPVNNEPGVDLPSDLVLLRHGTILHLLISSRNNNNVVLQTPKFIADDIV